MTKLYGYDRNDDGIMLSKRIYWEHPKQDSNSLNQIKSNQIKSNQNLLKVGNVHLKEKKN